MVLPVNLKSNGDATTILVIIPRDDCVCLLQAIEKCVDEGLVKNIGLSNFNSVQIQEIIDNSRIKPSVLQVKNCFTN